MVGNETCAGGAGADGVSWTGSEGVAVCAWGDEGWGDGDGGVAAEGEGRGEDGGVGWGGG